MSRDILLDRQTHDIVIDGYDLVIVRGVDLIRQRLKQRLLTVLGEWFLDVDIGLPWFDEIIGKGAEQQQISALLIQQIANTPGVDRIVEFNLDIDRRRRTMRVDFRVLAEGTEIAEEFLL